LETRGLQPAPTSSFLISAENPYSSLILLLIFPSLSRSHESALSLSLSDPFSLTQSGVQQDNGEGLKEIRRRNKEKEKRKEK
jgi:hypothetical protein